MEGPQLTGYRDQGEGFPPPQPYMPQPQAFPAQADQYKVDPSQYGPEYGQPYPDPQQYGQPPPQQYGQPPKYEQPPQQYGQPMAPQYQPQSQQSTSTNVVVVGQQPTLMPVAIQTPIQDHYLTLSVVMSILCFVCCGWFGLICTLPAIFFASAARDAERRGDIEGARSKARGALILNIAAIVWWIVSVVLYVIIVSVRVTASGNDCYYNYYYEYYYC